MKLLVLIFLSVFWAVPVKASLKFCNKTPIELWTAVGYLQSGKWFSEGWWKTSPGGCTTPIVGQLNNRYYYYRTQNASFRKYWGGGNYSFCVHPTKRFGPTGSNNCPRGFRMEKFNQIDIGNRKSHTLNLTCDSCRNPDFQLSGRNLLVNYLHKDRIEGQAVSFSTRGRFSATGGGNRLRISYNINVGLNDLQKKLTSMLRPKVDQSNECGDNVRLQNASLKLHSKGRARVDVNIHFERWVCTYADIPEVKCTDTWIKAFGIKTKGVPKCTTRMVTKRTSKNRLFETGISGTLVLTPSISGRNRVRLAAEVTNVRVRNDLARFLVNIMNVDLKRLAQRELEQNLGNGGAIEGAVPIEFQPYFRIGQAAFYDRGNGHLGVRATGSAQVTYAQVIGLCRKHTRLC